MASHRKGSTNLIPYSDTLDDVSWDTYRIQTRTSGQASPDRFTNAYKIEPDNTNSGAHNIRQNLAGRTNGLDYVYSAYAKPNGIGGFGMNVDGPNTDSNPIGFNLATGAIHGSGPNILDAGIIPMYGGAYRCWFKHNYTGTNTLFHLLFSDVSAFEADGSFLGWANTGTLGIDVFGVQVQFGELTDYIPTSGSAVTTAQDYLLMNYNGNVYVDYGIILFRYTPNTLPTAASGILSYTGGITNQMLWQEPNGVFKTHDSVNTTSHTATYAAGDDILIALCYRSSTGENSLMVSINGNSFTSTDGFYDGSYALVNNYLYLFTGSAPSCDLQSFKAYHTGFGSSTLTEMKNWAIANAHIETN